MAITKAQSAFLQDLREKTAAAGKQLKELQRMLTFPQTVREIESTQTAVLMSEAAARAAMAELAETEKVKAEKVKAEKVKAEETKAEETKAEETKPTAKKKK
jgi:hypothetical protein